MWPFSRRGHAEANPPAAPAGMTRQEPPPVNRMAQPGPLTLQRAYRAARPDRLAAGFGVFPTSVKDETRRDIRGLVQHSRHAAQNFDLARSYEMLFRRHVIGPNGIRLQMDVRDENGTRDAVACAKIEAAWAAWGKRGSPTLDGRLSWWGVECAVATALAREGGAFIRLHPGKRHGPFAFRVEPVVFDRLDLDYNALNRDGGHVESGIEFDGDGRVVAYHVWNRHPAEATIPNARVRQRVPAADMIHVLVPEEIGQVLGVPRSATALRLMNMSETFQESAMAAANYGAANMVFFTQTDESGQISGSAGRDAEVPIDDIEGGTMAVLPPGMKPEPFNPHYPEAAIEPFMRHMMTTIAAGLGVSAETLTGDLSRATFSALRAGKGEERDEWRMLQRAVFDGLHTPVFERWLQMALMTPALALPPERMEKFNAPVWRPRGWASVNPKDDAGASQVEMALGLRSRTEIAAERGRDFADICAERKAEADLLETLGLADAPAAIPGAPAPVPTPANDEADE